MPDLCNKCQQGLWTNNITNVSLLHLLLIKNLSEEEIYDWLCCWLHIEDAETLFSTGILIFCVSWFILSRFEWSDAFTFCMRFVAKFQFLLSFTDPAFFQTKKDKFWVIFSLMLEIGTIRLFIECVGTNPSVLMRNENK